MGKVNFEQREKWQALSQEMLKSFESKEIKDIRNWPIFLNSLKQMSYTEIDTIDLATIFLIVNHWDVFKDDRKEFNIKLREYYKNQFFLPDDSYPNQAIAYLTMDLFKGNQSRQLTPELFSFFVDDIINKLSSQFHDIYDDGNTPLVWAIANANISFLSDFLKAVAKHPKAHSFTSNIDKHYKKYSKGSALFLACAKGDIHHDRDNPPAKPLKMSLIINKLLEMGANPLDRCEADSELYGLCPMELIILRRSPKTLQLMIDNIDMTTIDENAIKRFKLLLQFDYQQAKSIVSTCAGVFTFPSQSAWEKSQKEIKTMVTKIEKQVNDSYYEVNSNHLNP